jgi:23S rRNA (adenine2503-C2)-methyltransferase
LHLLIYKNKMNSIQDCAQLPKMFRDALEAEGWSMGRSTIHHSTISSDGTVKILLRLVDSRLVETVGIPVEEKSGGSRLTACVSSQVGCPLGCTFCATGKGGFARNLKPHEIIEQVYFLLLPCPMHKLSPL